MIMDMHNTETRWYLCCAAFGGLLGSMDLDMTGWRFWVLVVFFVISTSWISDGRKVRE